MKNINLDKLILFLIKSLFFLLPLLILPWSFAQKNFSKGYVLSVLMFAIIASMVFRAIKNKEIKFKRTPLDLAIVLFLFLTFLSSIFSVNLGLSFLGEDFGPSIFIFGLGSLLYFLLTNYLQDKNIFKILKPFIYAYCASILLVFLSIINFEKLSFLNFFDFNKAPQALVDFLVFSSIGFILVLGSLIFNKKIFKIKEVIVIKFFLALNFLLLLALDLTEVYVILIFGLVLFLFILFKKKKKVKSFVVLTFVFIVISNVLFFGNSISKSFLGQEIKKVPKLSYSETLPILFGALDKNLTLGTGPGTFAYDFSLYRDKTMNEKNNWQYRFKNAVFALEFIAGLGVVGFLGYFLVVCLSLFLVFVFIRGYKINRETINAFYFSIVLGLLIFAQFLFEFSLIIWLLFWIVLAIVEVLFKNIGLFKIKDTKIKFKIFKSIAPLVLIIIFILLSLGARFFIADILASQGGIANFQKALNFENNYKYKMALSKLYIDAIKIELAKPVEFRNNKNIVDMTNKSLGLAKEAVFLAPNSVVAQEYLAVLYRDFKYLGFNEDMLAVHYFKRAIDLEPSNPVLWAELGEIYVGLDMRDKAKEAFFRSKKLKRDYLKAELGLARVYSLEKNNKKALEILNDLSSRVSDIDVYYEKGRLYYNEGEIMLAIENFKKVLILNPNHSNALYSIGLALEFLGKDQEAVKYFEKVLKLNPGNKDVKNRIDVLRSF